jgi:hypothetical protein
MAEAEKKIIQVDVKKDLSTATINGTKIEVGSDSNVVVHMTKKGVETKPAVAAVADEAKPAFSVDSSKVSMYGATVEQAADGSPIVSTNGHVKVKPAKKTLGAIFRKAVLGVTLAAATFGIGVGVGPLITGQPQSDSTVYADISPDTNKAMYAFSADADKPMTMADAREYCADHDARLPTKGELNVLFNNRVRIGGFNETNSYPDGDYWSSTPGPYDSTYSQMFSNGHQVYVPRNLDLTVRCVRSQDHAVTPVSQNDAVTTSAAGARNDATVYAGISPDTNKAMYAFSADADGQMSQYQAVRYCSEHGARLPTQNELNVLFTNRAKIGIPNEGAGDYWSSTLYNNTIAYGQRFSDGDQFDYHRNAGSSVRCVR